MLRFRQHFFISAAALWIGSGLCATMSADDREPFTVVVLPDTQFYAEKYPEIFTAQTEWVRQNHEAKNIKFVLHVGDITQHNSVEQWEDANASLSVLDGHVPYSLCVGNHDMGAGGSTQDRSSLFDEYFGVARYKSLPWYGRHYADSNRNHFCFFDSAGMKFMVINIEYGPTDEILKWANETISRYPGHRVIVVTHAYMCDDNTRLDRNDRSNPHLEIFGPTNDGEEMWEKLIRKHKNIFLVNCGHIDCDRYSYLTSEGDHGNRVHQVLTNYQHMERGGSGYLVLMRFIPGENKIQLSTYSPVLKDFLRISGNELELEYDMQW